MRGLQGVSKAKGGLKLKYEPRLKLMELGGRGVKAKKPYMGGVRNFFGKHNFCPLLPSCLIIRFVCSVPNKCFQNTYLYADESVYLYIVVNSPSSCLSLNIIGTAR